MSDLLEAFKQYKETDAYKKAAENSKERMDDQERTCRKIWWAKANLERGRILAEQSDEDSLDYYELSPEDQELVEEYDTGRAEATSHSLEAGRSAVYRGTHVEAST